MITHFMVERRRSRTRSTAGWRPPAARRPRPGSVPPGRPPAVRGAGSPPRGGIGQPPAAFHPLPAGRTLYHPRSPFGTAALPGHGASCGQPHPPAGFLHSLNHPANPHVSHNYMAEPPLEQRSLEMSPGGAPRRSSRPGRRHRIRKITLLTARQRPHLSAIGSVNLGPYICPPPP